MVTVLTTNDSRVTVQVQTSPDELPAGVVKQVSVVSKFLRAAGSVRFQLHDDGSLGLFIFQEFGDTKCDLVDVETLKKVVAALEQTE